MAEAEGAGGSPAAEEVKPYRIHVSTKYLDLTKQKLELTRLPHELSQPRAEDWWEPKAQVEPLIDYWLEKYSWRDQETNLNNIAQFRTAISVPSSEAPLRIHFIHVRSAHANALPLLLIPPFPFSNLSLTHLVKPLTDPEDVANNQPFHLVIPSLPGLGFSDAFPNNISEISTAADMLDTLMRRLSYSHYLVSNAGAAQASPAEIDWRLVSSIATHYPDSCVGSHFISPPIASPKLSEAPWEWTKWSIASFFHAGILGYSDDDFSALKQARKPSTPAGPSVGGSVRKKERFSTAELGLNRLGLREPNTLAYAMCDSPVGLLVFVLAGLRLLSQRAQFTPDEIITFTQLAWVPGPEYAMRFWAHCAAHDERIEKDKGKSKGRKDGAKPRVAITVFLGEKGDEAVQDGNAADAETIPMVPIARGEGSSYSCPAWGNAHYIVVFSQRLPGRAGLLAWERPETVATGVRGLAREILRVDERIKPSAAEAATVPLVQVVVPQETAAPTVPATTSPAGPAKPSTPSPSGSSSRLSPPAQSRKGKEPESPSSVFLSAIPEEQRHEGGSRTPFSEGESPDTLVVTTPSVSP
ncbi:Alpha/beta-hydrolase [Pleurostoma richardsiae]|uniref:Alpha/beta-hydrolase n=1 Tax=Pleurostoma richardsiae TaxID=41990 RepID=A0AA38RUN2_9PEZI|nr:Alpha/beta-hydrolase [Pleurostoma richardsiae]